MSSTSVATACSERRCGGALISSVMSASEVTRTWSLDGVVTLNDLPFA